MRQGFLSSVLYTRACTSTTIVTTLNNLSTHCTTLSNPPKHLGTGIKLFSTSVSYVHCICGLQATKWNGRGKKGRMSTQAMGKGFLGFGKKEKAKLPEIVKAGDPVLHEPAMEVALEDIGSDRIQKIIDDMIAVMRDAPGVGLAAPQIGVPLEIIVLEDTKEYISYAPKEETESQQRMAFDLLVIINPKLKPVGDKTAKFFEGCLSVDGYRGLVERHLEVQVTGLGRDGLPIKVDANGWQARILQHECDHVAGLLYVDKMIPRTFRTVENLRLPLAAGCPKPGTS